MTNQPTAQDIDETARLILMDGVSRMYELKRQLEEYYPGVTFGVEGISAIWAKYVGFDGRVMPTHSVETGEPI